MYANQLISCCYKLRPIISASAGRCISIRFNYTGSLAISRCLHLVSVMRVLLITHYWLRNSVRNNSKRPLLLTVINCYIGRLFIATHLNCTRIIATIYKYVSVKKAIDLFICFWFCCQIGGVLGDGGRRRGKGVASVGGAECVGLDHWKTCSCQDLVYVFQTCLRVIQRAERENNK